MKIKYIGPHDEVEIPTLDAVCKQGDSIDVDDKIALGMIEQEVWVSAAPRVSSKKSEGDDK